MTSGRGHLGGRRGGMIVCCVLSIVHSIAVSVRHDVGCELSRQLKKVER